jgi:phosphoribosyl 1,2-cyclic phosphodiesterase
LLEFSVLASGSSGNALYIRSETTNLLLDAGISGKQIQQRLQSAMGQEMSSIGALLLTHEHIDHVRGVRQVLKHSGAKIYTSQGTWQHVKGQLKEDEQATPDWVYPGQTFVIGDIQVTPFAISHDAEEPVMYRFDSGDSSLAVVTDLGYVSDPIKDVLRGCQTFIWESNHDVEMLRAGRYPWSVKRRIIGDKGHLSNYDAAVALADILGTDGIDVYLAHLSEENNQPDLAELTVQSVLTEINSAYQEQVQLHRTSRQNATPAHILA